MSKKNQKFKGILLDFKDELIEGSEFIGWFSRSMAVTVVIKLGDSHFLVEKRGPGCPDNVGKYVFPCGYLDWDETLKEAAVREVYEETGLKIKEEDLKFIGFNDKPSENHQNVTARFLAELDYMKVFNLLQNDQINTKTELRGGEPGECDNLLIMSKSAVKLYKDNFAFGHGDLALSVLDSKKKKFSWFKRLFRHV